MNYRNLFCRYSYLLRLSQHRRIPALDARFFGNGLYIMYLPEVARILLLIYFSLYDTIDFQFKEWL
jgi:hypothetical protein